MTNGISSGRWNGNEKRRERNGRENENGNGNESVSAGGKRNPATLSWPAIGYDGLYLIMCSHPGHDPEAETDTGTTAIFFTCNQLVKY